MKKIREMSNEELLEEIKIRKYNNKIRDDQIIEYNKEIDEIISEAKELEYKIARIEHSIERLNDNNSTNKSYCRQIKKCLKDRG